MIRAEQLSVCYKETVVEKTDLSIGLNERIILFGESGSGKTSLFRLLSGIQELPGDARLFWNTRRVRNVTQASRLRKDWMGLYFAQPRFISGLSILENLTFPASVLNLRKSKVDEQLEFQMNG